MMILPSPKMVRLGNILPCACDLSLSTNFVVSIFYQYTVPRNQPKGKKKDERTATWKKKSPKEDGKYIG